MKTTGYSGTPLAKKLGIKKGFKIKIVEAPEYYFNLFSELPADLTRVEDQETKKDFIHYFAKSSSQLAKDIKRLKQEILQNGIIWVSWPKKTAKVESDLDGNIVREIGLKNGLVDTKVCAVDETWSGLKFVIPLKERR
ncbi:MAG: hypothetical protein ACK5HT_12965 [Draconibacterium sp.]